MTDSKRALIAGIAVRLINGGVMCSVYSFADKEYYSFRGTIEKNGIYLYDDIAEGYLSGAVTLIDEKRKFRAYSLYDYKTRCYITLDFNILGTFSGYDYNSKTYYTGAVNGNYATVYDYQTRKNYRYALGTTVSIRKESKIEEVKPLPPMPAPPPKPTPPPQMEIALPGVITCELPPYKEPPLATISSEQLEDDIERDMENLEYLISKVKENKRTLKELRKVLKEKKKEEKREKTRNGVDENE